MKRPVNILFLTLLCAVLILQIRSCMIRRDSRPDTSTPPVAIPEDAKSPDPDVDDGDIQYEF